MCAESSEHLEHTRLDGGQSAEASLQGPSFPNGWWHRGKKKKNPAEPASLKLTHTKSKMSAHSVLPEGPSWL